LQAQFQAFVLSAAGHPPLPVTNGIGAAVYAEGYFVRLTDALVNDFPALHKLLGAESFAALARRYALTRPSRDCSLRWFGRHLPEFMRVEPPFAGSPHLAELATVEWLLGEAFDAAAERPLEADSLRNIAPEQWGGLRFRFHPSLRRLDLHFDTFNLWQALSDGTPPDDPSRPAPGAFVIWRRELDVLYRPLAAGEATALDALRESRTLGATAERLLSDDEDIATQAPALLAGWVRAWIEQGLVTHAHTTPDE
jgi:hypothetical protein